MTHIENVPHIIKHGITHRLSPNANPKFIPIGDSTLITTRYNFILDNGKLLGEYVPFYFGTRTPMLYVIQKGFNGIKPIAAEEIVYVVSSVQQIIDNGFDFVFTDGHAVDSFSIQYSKKDVDNLYEILDWQAIKSNHWKSETDLDLKRRKQAEFLVLGDIPQQAVLFFGVYNQDAKNKLLKTEIASDKIIVRNKHYFEL
jgi:hypothetical protein